MTCKIPNVYIPERLLNAMVGETLSHPLTETGQSMLGIETEEYTFILGTIPDALDTHRSPGMFRLGGVDQVEVFRWYSNHWESMRRVNGDIEWSPGVIITKGTIPGIMNFPLSVVGDWHRHPGSYKQLSGTDLNTIRSILRDKDQKRDKWLAPILVHDPHYRHFFRIEGSELVIAETGNEFRINWYYLHEDCRNVHNIHQVIPTIVPDEQLPWLPPLPWHLTDIHRMQQELAYLKEAGYTVRWMSKEVDGDPFIQEIVFGVDHPNWDKRLLIITYHDYPKSRPTFRIISKGGEKSKEESNRPVRTNRFSRLMNIFEFLRRLNNQRDADIWETSDLHRLTMDKQTYLIDLVRQLEPQLKKQEVIIEEKKEDEDDKSDVGQGQQETDDDRS